MLALQRRGSTFVTTWTICLPNGGQYCQTSYSGRMTTLLRGILMMLGYGPSFMVPSTSSTVPFFVMRWITKFKLKISGRLSLTQLNLGAAQCLLHDPLLIRMPIQTYYVLLKHVSAPQCKARQLLITL